MAGNKGKRSLDLATRNTLTALEKALEMSCDFTLRDDEFTIDDYIRERKLREPDATDDACRGAMTRLVARGVFSVRKVRVNGRQCNAYSAK
jgi:hypothetical protein